MLKIKGTVRQGYGVASGRGDNPPYPGGTIAMQAPHFAELGLDLSPYFPGTLNVDISPLAFSLNGGDYHFPLVRWTDRIPPETFSFSCCRLSWKTMTVDALIYYPHPETKVEHYQSHSLMEILAPKIKGITAGDSVEVAVNDAHIALA